MPKSSSQRTRKRISTASRADRHELYERAVQDPESDITFLTRTFERLRGRPPLSLREDFCGTASFCAAWVGSRRDRTAIGIDLDPDTLAWGKRRHLASAPEHVGRRVHLHQADVRDAVGAKSDITCAFNFSYFVFKSCEGMRHYFRAVRSRLVDDGMFFIDLYGGPDSIKEDVTDTDYDDFLYHWDQAFFNPLTHDTLCHIHFSFPDGSRLNRAFSYDWRLWTVPELREILLEVGFRKVHCFWERSDRNGEGTGVFYEPKGPVHAEDCWWTYIAAER